MSEGQTTLRARGLEVKSDRSRTLFRDLNIQLKRERVALVGRNGSGKSTLLEVLAGASVPEKGRVHRSANTTLVRQTIDQEALAADLLSRRKDPEFSRALDDELHRHGWNQLVEHLDQRRALDRLSLGQLRILALVRTKLANPSLVVLDEPSQHLDETARAWLQKWIASYSGGLLVVSHARDVLEQFGHFFIVAESGCRLFKGCVDELESELELRDHREQLRYIRNLERLEHQEQRSATIESRRRRKKNLGRLHEIGRAPSRATLNENRSYAQQSQGRRGKQRRERLAAIREWTKETRRALTVNLPLEAAFAELGPILDEPTIEINGASLVRNGSQLFANIGLQLNRQRVAIVGRNGSGKTSLIELATGQLTPTSGQVRVRHQRIGIISQGADEWACQQSLFDRLSAAGLRLSELTNRLAGHRFPPALSRRPMKTLSPGERLRAALIHLSTQTPRIELLVLDEPTAHLDFLGRSSLHSVLNAWTGGLLVATHDRNLLEAVRFDSSIVLGNR